MSASQRIGQMTAELLEDLEERYEGQAEVLDALIVVDVQPNTDEDGGTIIESRSTTDRVSLAVGLAECAIDSMLEPYHRGEDE